MWGPNGDKNIIDSGNNSAFQNGDQQQTRGLCQITLFFQFRDYYIGRNSAGFGRVIIAVPLRQREAPDFTKSRAQQEPARGCCCFSQLAE